MMMTATTAAIVSQPPGIAPAMKAPMISHHSAVHAAPIATIRHIKPADSRDSGQLPNSQLPTPNFQTQLLGSLSHGQERWLGDRTFLQPQTWHRRQKRMTRRKMWIVIAGTLLIWTIVSGVSHYRRALARTREATLSSHLFRMRDAIDAFRRENGVEPPSLAALVERKYLRSVPEDPFTKSSQTWRLIPAAGTTAISDVKSGAMGHATDGSRLSDW